MNKVEERADGRRRLAVIAGVAVVAAVAGLYAGRLLAPSASTPARPRQPIVQIVRPQAGLPSLADTIAGICPSIAAMVPGPASAGEPARAHVDGQPAAAAVPAFVASADGWLVTTASIKAESRMHAVFGNGTRADISEIRVDPISGLALAKASTTGLTPVTMADQAFPRVGDFGFAVETGGANGCTAQIAMIAGDFLADGGGPVSYVRTDIAGTPVPAGSPFLNSNGQAVAIAIADPDVAGAMIPAAIAGIVIDELIRGAPSPSIAFGFRATDFSPAVADRLSNARLRGAGVAVVQPGSAADKAGLRAGDVVVAVADSPVSSASELGRALDAAKDKASLTVMRGDKRLAIAIPRTKAAA